MPKSRTLALVVLAASLYLGASLAAPAQTMLLPDSMRDVSLSAPPSFPRSAASSSKSAPEHYLLLVNTAVAMYMTEEKLRQFDKSPYDGLAVAFLHAYDTSEPPSVAAIDGQINAWRQFTGKDIWPWVYANRLIGRSAAENNPHSDTPYFRGISGADLDDAKGARSDFLKMWRNSLSAARDSRIPGIICDLEFYNYYKEYDIGEVARLTNKTPAEAADAFRAIGTRMAQTAAEVYPNAVLWLLFAGLTHPGYKTLGGDAYYPSPTYIAIGLLDEILAKHLPLKVLAGGEGSIGYCHESLDAFRQSIQKRQADLAPLLQKYSGILELAGTLALFSDREAKKDWLTQGTCQASDAANIEGLQTYIELLLKTYRYNWLYGTSEGNYLPFSPASAPRFDAVIRKAQAHAAN